MFEPIEEQNNSKSEPQPLPTYTPFLDHAVYHFRDSARDSRSEYDEGEDKYLPCQDIGDGAYAKARLFTSGDKKRVVLHPKVLDADSKDEVMRKHKFFKVLYPETKPRLYGTDDTYRLILPLIPGESYESFANPNVKLTREGQLRLFLSTVRELIRCHSLNYVVVDLKPDNIFYDFKTGRSYLIDGGMSAQIGELLHKQFEAFNDAMVMQCRRSRKQFAPECTSTTLQRATTAMDVYSLGQLMKTVFFFKEMEGVPELYNACLHQEPEKRITLDDLETKLMRMLPPVHTRRRMTTDIVGDELHITRLIPADFLDDSDKFLSQSPAEFMDDSYYKKPTAREIPQLPIEEAPKSLQLPTNPGIPQLPIPANRPLIQPDFRLSRTTQCVFVIFSDREKAETFRKTHAKHIHSMWDEALKGNLPVLDDARIPQAFTIRIPISIQVKHQPTPYTYAQFCQDSGLDLPALDTILPEITPFTMYVFQPKNPKVFIVILNKMIQAYENSGIYRFNMHSPDSRQFIHDLKQLLPPPATPCDDFSMFPHFNNLLNCIQNYLEKRYIADNKKSNKAIELLIEFKLISPVELLRIQTVVARRKALMECDDTFEIALLPN